MQHNKTIEPSLRFDASSPSEFVRSVEADFVPINAERCKFWFSASTAPAEMQLFIYGNAELRTSTIRFELISALGEPRWKNITPARKERPTIVKSDKTQIAEVGVNLTAVGGPIYAPHVNVVYRHGDDRSTQQMLPDSVIIRTESSKSQITWKLLFLRDSDPEYMFRGEFGVEFHRSAQLVRFQSVIDISSIRLTKVLNLDVKPVIGIEFLNMLLTMKLRQKVKDNERKVIFSKDVLRRGMSRQKCFHK